MAIDSDIQATWSRSKAAKRQKQAQEIAPAIAYVSGDMQADTESILASRYRAAQSGSMPESMIEGVAVGIVQQYVDEMASLYTGTVTRTVYNGDKEDSQLTDLLNESFERIGYNQRMRAIERITVLARSCAQAWSFENGRLDPIVYPPNDVWPVKPKGKRINPTNQDSYAGYVLDMHDPSYDGVGDRSRSQYTYVTPAGATSYSGRSVREVDSAKVEQKNPLLWSQPVVGKNGKPSGSKVQPLQPVVVWHNELPTSGELMPLNVPTVYRANRWINVLWSVVLNVLRFQAGATEVRSGVDRDSSQRLEPTGVFFPALMEAGEDMAYANPANDYEGAINLLNAFAKTLGMTLSLSPTDLSIEGKVESGIARMIANIPKERRRSERAEHFGLLESEYVYPRAAAGLIWLGTMPARARQAHMVTEYRPKPLPMSQTEQIEVENHDLAIGVSTPAHILAARMGISVEDAKATILSIRESQQDMATEDLGAGQAVEQERVPEVLDVLNAAGAGTLPVDSARALLSIAFKLNDPQIDALLQPITDVEDEAAAAAEVESLTAPAGVIPADDQPSPAQVSSASSPEQETQPTEDKPGNGSESLIERLVKAKPGAKKEQADDGAS